MNIAASNPAAPHRRAPSPPDTLKPTTVQWLAALPPPLRPRQLPIKFVRVANRLADVWHDAAACSAYFQELLLDGRGGRAGFPRDVGTELAALQDYFEGRLHEGQQTVWDQIAGHRRSA